MRRGKKRRAKLEKSRFNWSQGSFSKGVLSESVEEYLEIYIYYYDILYLLIMDLPVMDFYDIYCKYIRNLEARRYKHTFMFHASILKLGK